MVPHCVLLQALDQYSSTPEFNRYVVRGGMCVFVLYVCVTTRTARVPYNAPWPACVRRCETHVDGHHCCLRWVCVVYGRYLLFVLVSDQERTCLP